MAFIEPMHYNKPNITYLLISNDVTVHIASYSYRSREAHNGSHWNMQQSYLCAKNTGVIVRRKYSQTS